MEDSSAASISVMRGDNAYQHWLLTCGQNPWEPLSPDAAKPYGFIWQSWLRFLAGGNVDGDPHAWAQATPQQVLAFINLGPQSPKRSQPSDITRRRYWRVLDRVYDHALLHHWVSSNPAQGLTAQDLPPSEDPKGAILSPRMWRALERQLPAPDDLISCRDRAVLMLLMELGLTPEEVRFLEMGNLRWTEDAPQKIEAIQVVGARDKQSRTLPVSDKLFAALRYWLQARAGYHAMQGQSALFCTRKAPQLSNHTLLHLVTKTLRQAALAAKLPEPARMGPQVLRNTVLVQWIEAGCSVDEVLERAGMKSPNALQHLRAYFSDDVNLAPRPGA
ncbi:tyrosine-type recombinase/integrase [Comamonas sp. NoAH]|uniref:tyrosine-type recombinase/integrase n=1 Tax=Comamonas halotolerans TaxID=3041496 RepID=UPI0024E1904D|nr:tyrosine-type recombinase/integrase [Comamonas sp. NoAH]